MGQDFGQLLTIKLLRDHTVISITLLGQECPRLQPFHHVIIPALVLFLHRDDFHAFRCKIAESILPRNCLHFSLFFRCQRFYIACVKHIIILYRIPEKLIILLGTIFFYKVF